MKNLLCCVFLAVSLFLVQAGEESVKHAHHHPIFEEHFKNGAHNPEYDHLAILGSKKTEEEFSELEPDESKERLAQLIPKMDLNKDGKLVLPELQSWIFNSYKSLDDEEAREEFKSLDLDGNNKITWDEYLKKVYSYTPQELESIKQKNEAEMKEVNRMIGEDTAKFNQADLDNNGFLNITEFPAFLHPHDYEYMHDLEIKNALTEHDKNNDGKVDYKEYRTESDQHDPTEQIAEEAKFNDYDVNNDGFLDKTEMKAWILPNTMQNAKEEAQHLIEDTDINKDHELTVKEIVDNFELFVGSQATAYGRHLHLVKEEL